MAGSGNPCHDSKTGQFCSGDGGGALTGDATSDAPIKGDVSAGDTFSLGADKQLVYLGAGKARLEVKVHADRPWELAKDNIAVPPAAMAKWRAAKL